MDSEKQLDRIQKDLHLRHTATVEDIRFAKTQMWRITFYSVSLMLAIAFLRASDKLGWGDWSNILSIIFTSIIAAFGIALITKIQIDIHKKYRAKLRDTKNNIALLTNVFPKNQKFKSLKYDIEYYLILSLSIFSVALLLSFFSFK